jgi:ankyrin repeat protein
MIPIPATAPEGSKHWMLVSSAAANRLDEVMYLVDEGVLIDAQDPSGQTPLFAVAKHGDVDMLHLCISLEANPKHVAKNGQTLLHVAARNAKVEMVTHLARLGLYIDVKDTNGCTPLHMAVESGNADTVQTLLELGADRSVKDNYDMHCLDKAVSCRNTKIFKMLAQQW